MEKLQQALQKARADRAEADHGKSGAATGATAPLDMQGPGAAVAQAEPASATSADRWGALTPATPDPAHLTRHRVVTQSYNTTAIPFDILRTKVVLQMRKHGWRRLAITSATPTCGKSTITCNLAMGLSRQSDLQAIVMELDLRAPSLAKMLGLTPPRDVSKLLLGETAFSEQALRLGDRVALSLAKGPSSDPTRFLLSQNIDDVIAGIEAAYEPDLMIFDMPPVLVSDDTRAFLGKVDCAMIVARAERTTIAQIDACEREIAEQTNVLGVVLNQTRFADSEESYGYGE